MLSTSAILQIKGNKNNNKKKSHFSRCPSIYFIFPVSNIFREMDNKISRTVAPFPKYSSSPFRRDHVWSHSPELLAAVRPLRHSSTMASDSINSASSSEHPPKALISCASTSTKSRVESESIVGEIQENQPLIDDNPSSICVICFSDDGKAERGKLDSCDHYFCFVCIMEWARIESRCPTCKGRFTVVHRIAKDGCRFRERIVNIPMRNQVGNSAIYILLLNYARRLTFSFF